MQIKKAHFIKSNWKNTTWIFLLIFLPIFLIILPKTQFDHGPKMCIFSILTGNDCLGCGMTRACMRLIHLDILGAISFNKISLGLFPFLCFKYAQFFLKKINSD